MRHDCFRKARTGLLILALLGTSHMAMADGVPMASSAPVGFEPLQNVIAQKLDIGQTTNAYTNNVLVPLGMADKPSFMQNIFYLIEGLFQ